MAVIISAIFQAFVNFFRVLSKKLINILVFKGQNLLTFNVFVNCFCKFSLFKVKICEHFGLKIINNNKWY